jgi:hypothetical protein
VEVLGLEIESKDIGQYGVENAGKILDVFAGKVVGSAEFGGDLFFCDGKSGHGWLL